jgi:hypothetical protein
MAVRRKGRPGAGGDRDLRHFLIDIGYDEGEQFCKALLESGDFSQGLLRSFAERGAKGLSKANLAAEIAGQLVRDEIGAEEFVLAYCKQPRQWLCVRMGSCKLHRAPEYLSAQEFLTRREPDENTRVWYGPFGSGNERWFIGTLNVPHETANAENTIDRHFIRWHVIAQVTPNFVALHWNNFGHRTRDPIDQRFVINQYRYWLDIPVFFGDLADDLDGEWDREEPNLTNIILHGSFDRYSENPDFAWEDKGVRAAYQSVFLNASGGATGKAGDEQAARGLRILTTAMAKTATSALGRKDASSLAKVEHALRRMVLHEWGTKAYQFILEPKHDEEAEDDGDDSADASDNEDVTALGMRMHVIFGTETPRAKGTATIDSLQHVHCYARYGGSTRALRFILQEMENEEEGA